MSRRSSPVTPDPARAASTPVAAAGGPARRAWIAATVAAGASLVFAASAGAGQRSYPVDCLPDRVVVWNPVAADPDALFGGVFVPGVVLGPPGDSLAYDGATSVAALGFGGSAVLAFDDIVIEDRPGPDFIVFENAFFRLPVPVGPDDPVAIFAEPGIVEVSADGVAWTTFPFDAEALEASAGHDLDRATWTALTGLAGLTPTFTGNWTVPDDPALFDTAGPGGVSGAGGDAFDLATVGLAEARFVRVTDADTRNGFAGPAEGFDLDAVVVLHGRPRPPAAADSDGDRLSDAEEVALYGTNPALGDSDGDGVDDGREIAGCRDPGSTGTAPWLHAEPRVWLVGTTCTEVRWTFLGSGRKYDVARGEGGFLADAGGWIDLGPTSCLANDATGLRWGCDAGVPPTSTLFYYLVRVDGGSGWGRSSGLAPRESTGGCP